MEILGSRYSWIYLPRPDIDPTLHTQRLSESLLVQILRGVEGSDTVMTIDNGVLLQVVKQSLYPAGEV